MSRSTRAFTWGEEIMVNPKMDYVQERKIAGFLLQLWTS